MHTTDTPTGRGGLGACTQLHSRAMGWVRHGRARAYTRRAARLHAHASARTSARTCPCASLPHRTQRRKRKTAVRGNACRRSRSGAARRYIRRGYESIQYNMVYYDLITNYTYYAYSRSGTARRYTRRWYESTTVQTGVLY